MSESSSDTESSCGWTIISNEGSDVESLGPDSGLEYRADVLKTASALDSVAPNPPPYVTAECTEQNQESLFDAIVREHSLDDTFTLSEADGREALGDEQVTLCSSSDHSDIVTLGEVKETELSLWGDHVVAEEDDEKEVAISKEHYMGTSSSSQYAFSAAKTDSSSSENEAVEHPATAARRRRVRKSNASSMTEPEEEAQEFREKGEEEEEEEIHPEVQRDTRVPSPSPGHVSGTLSQCILLVLVIAISMSFGHFYGTVQSQKRMKIVEKIKMTDLGDFKDQCQTGNVITKLQVDNLREDLDKNDMVQSLKGIVRKITKEAQELRSQNAQLQAQEDELFGRLKQAAEDKNQIESQQLHLAAENQELKSSLEREEKSLSILQEEVRNLHSQTRDLEEKGTGDDSILSENQALKDHLEKEKQRIRKFLSQREVLMAEAQMLRKELEKEREVTGQLRQEQDQLSRRSSGDRAENDLETEELQSHLMELEKKLKFEQQRSDLWERLYVETKEERAKGETLSKVKKPKEGIIGKVKETFDSVKNSTKEFVHHHKEQIKKAKEAVKENLKKFSDSVKSTFRHFKDSASRVLDKARRPHDRRSHERKETQTHHYEQEHGNKYSDEESWQHRTHKPLHKRAQKSNDYSFQTNHNTRKSGGKLDKDTEAESPRGLPKGCNGVFDCAYQESMSLFNKAMDPIKADEFNQLLHSYLQQEVGHFHHWTELESFINNFFHNGVFIHDQMLFTDFVSGVEDYLEDMHEYHRLDDDVFEDLDEFVYRHFFGDTYSKYYGPSRPFEGPETGTKEQRQAKQQRKQQRPHPRSQRERKWSKSERNTDRHMADVKIELGPMPFDPKY
ncbi:cell cycle progression protein 1 isoform 2-T2 [Aplochiton taeniatus]